MRALLAAVALAAAAAVAVPPAGAAAPGLTVTGLRVDYLDGAPALDDRTPQLTWQLASPGRHVVPTAYQVQAATSPHRLDAGHPDLWDTGRTSGSATTATYAGRALTSREPVYWRVRSWDGAGHVSPWTAAHFELALLKPADWQAHWITEHSWAVQSEPQPVVVPVTAQDTRYVRLDVTELGRALKEPGFPDPVWRLQLAEIAVLDGAGTDVAQGAGVTASDSFTVPGAWEPAFLTDGQLAAGNGRFGYTSLERHSADAHIWVQLDLGTVRHIDRVLLYPRTDLQTDDGQVPNFPVDYTIQTADQPSGPFGIAASVTGQQPPPPPGRTPPALPMLARPFTVTGPVATARLYITGLGLVDTLLNGRPVSDAVLQPPNTAYTQRVEYATYDLTAQLRPGANTLSALLGNGLYNVPSTPGRYEKLTRSDGPPKLLAQLEITYRDGHRAVIGTDESWRATLGPVTFSNWYGGEDVDARRPQPTDDPAGWPAAVVTDPPGPDTVLSAQATPPVQVVDTVHPVAITQPRKGVWVADFGRQLAGWEQLQVSGPAGTTVTMRPAERLAADGTALQDGGSGAPFRDSYTLAGRGVETWHPRFVYHGFRYLQLDGLPSAPDHGTVSALVLRAGTDATGRFDSSDGLLDGIHRMLSTAIASNLVLFGSDPNREKLGWLADYAFELPSIARDYDVAAYYRLLVQDMADAQTPQGLVPDIAPEYTVFSGGFRDDPNWGSAIVTVPWELYQTYGDTGTIRRFYPNMQRYVDYLGGKASGDILDYGLGEWGTLDGRVPTAFTATWAYYRDTTLLARTARVLGRPDDAARYEAAAARIATACNARLFDAGAGTYQGGSQSVDAMALDAGLVPADQRGRVLEHLLASLRANDYHVTTGMIALPSLFRVLSDTGHDDVVYAIATALDAPSYGWLLVHGETSMTEFWQGADNPAGSEHNMFILAALEEWFTRGVGGIRPDANSGLAADHLTIRPAAVGALGGAAATLQTVHGEVSTRWQRAGHSFSLAVELPAGVGATVVLPDGSRHEVGSGRWTFPVSGLPALPADHPRTWLDAPPSAMLVAGLPTTVPVRVVNLADGTATLHPRVDVPAGYHVAGVPAAVRLAPTQGADLPVRITRDAGATDGALTLTIGDARARVALGATEDVVRAATMTASSTYPGFPLSTLNDGDTSTAAWCAGQTGHGWNDATEGVFPDDVTATFPAPVDIGRVVVTTLSRATCPYGGVSDADVQVQVDGAWRTVATVRGNTGERIEVTFPVVAAGALRVHVLDSTTHDFSRLVEVEAYRS